MSLADAPVETSYRIRSEGCLGDRAALHALVGVSAGRQARVLARYPQGQPMFVEVEIDNERLVTLPIGYAEQVLLGASVEESFSAG